MQDKIHEVIYVEGAISRMDKNYMSLAAYLPFLVKVLQNFQNEISSNNKVHGRGDISEATTEHNESNISIYKVQSR